VQQVVKVISYKTALPQQTDASIVFGSWRQCAFPCGHTGATWWIRLNLCFLWPTWVRNPNGKSIGSAVSAKRTAESPYILQWATISPKIAPSHGGSGPPSNLISLASPSPQSKRCHHHHRHHHHHHHHLFIHDRISCFCTDYHRVSQSVQPFLHRWPHSVPILYNGMPISTLKISPPHRGMWTPIWYMVC